MSKEAINAAIEALKASKHGNCDHAWADEAIAGLQALAKQPAQPQQEPFGYVYEVFCLPDCATEREWVQTFTTYTPEPDSDICNVVAVYTSPPAQRKPLTDEQMAKALPRPWPEEGDRVCLSPTELRQFAHGIKKNT